MPTLQQRDLLLHAPGWLRPWRFRRRISIDNSAQASALTDFPLTVKLTASRINYANTQAGGADLRFTDAAGNVLAHEIESWSAGGTSLAHVRVPSIPASSPAGYVWMYYGNPAAADGQDKANVWRSEYKAVYHLSESGNGTAGEYKDSTSNANHGRGGNGVAANVPAQNTSGAVGNAQTFDGTGDYILVPNAASLYVSGAFSVGAWVYRTGSPSSSWGGYIFCDYNSAGNACSFALLLNGSSATPNTVGFFWENGGAPQANSSTVLALNTWYHVVGTWDGTTRRLYINGAADGTNATAQSRSDNGGDTAIGRAGSYTDLFFPGALDEVFLYSGALSAAWIAATYKSQADTFCTFGSEE